MGEFWTAIVAPLIVLVLGLIVEYGIIQPRQDERKFRDVPKQDRRDWSAATIKALNNFTSQIPNYNGLIRRKIRWVEAQEVRRGHSIVWLSVSEARVFWANWFKPPVVGERYEVILDRAGDILAAKSLPVAKAPTGENPGKSKKVNKPKTQQHSNPYAAYLYILVGLLGGSGGFSAIATLYYSTSSSFSPDADGAFWWFLIAAVLLGIALAILTDIYFRMEQAFAWQRLPLSLVAGFIGGWLGILIIFIAFFAFIFFIIFLIIRKLFFDGW